MPGYSGTPLPKKLGVIGKTRVALIDAPAGLIEQLEISSRSLVKSDLEFALLFVTSQRQLNKQFPTVAAKLVSDGMLWVAWPKKTSGVATDLTEDEVRRIGLGHGLVDVKVCAITEIWSGLKFVFRLKDRSARSQERAKRARP